MYVFITSDADFAAIESEALAFGEAEGERVAVLANSMLVRQLENGLLNALFGVQGAQFKDDCITMRFDLNLGALFGSEFKYQTELSVADSHASVLLAVQPSDAEYATAVRYARDCAGQEFNGSRLVLKRGSGAYVPMVEVPAGSLIILRIDETPTSTNLGPSYTMEIDVRGSFGLKKLVSGREAVGRSSFGFEFAPAAPAAAAAIQAPAAPAVKPVMRNLLR